MVSKISVERFITTHLGHGDPSSPVWYVGLEPGGSGTIDDLRNRVASFEAQGSPNLTNLRQELKAIGADRWFAKERPPTQAYWRRVAFFDILLKDSTRESPPSTNEIAAYQRNVLCAEITTGPAMLEISALPAVGTSKWTYGEMNLGIPEIASRKLYRDSTIIEQRVELMVELMKKHTPKLVLLMGSSTGQIAETLKKRVPNTRFELVKHPNARGVSNQEWFKKAKYLRELL